MTNNRRISCIVCMPFLVVPSSGRADLQLFTLAMQTNNERLTRTILPPVLTIYSTAVLYR